MGVTPRQPIRRMDINAFDLAACDRVPQPLQRRTRQNRTAVALILVTLIRFQQETIRDNALAQRDDPACDRVVARLALTGYARIEGAPDVGHRSPPAFAVFNGETGAPPRFDRGRARRTVGTRRS